MVAAASYDKNARKPGGTALETITRYDLGLNPQRNPAVRSRAPLRTGVGRDPTCGDLFTLGEA